MTSANKSRIGAAVHRLRVTATGTKPSGQRVVGYEPLLHTGLRTPPDNPSRSGSTSG